MNEHGDILPYTPMKKIINLKWYIQYIMDENEDEAQILSVKKIGRNRITANS